ncbi:MAG: apolipoprotein N-acyltransferase [Alteromonadaceae bacterium]|jgi:apolipoprotein N-acyltransferase|tara:strand:+ start:3670 stop:5235 length:1566 start_codon:yes stop_codon:yes gene_type:complete
MLIKSVKRLFNNLKDRNNILSFFLGLSLVFAYAPFSQWWLALIIPALWFNLIDRKSVKIAIKQGFFFGLGWFCSGISWVHVSIDQFGGLPLAISLLLMLFLCIYLALYPAIACYLSARLAQNKQLNLWLLPAFWLISEYLRSEVLTGFPWLSLGYSQIDGPLAAYAPVIGEIGITCLILIINILIFKLIFKVKQQVPLVNILHFTSLLIIILLTFSLQNISWVTPTNKSITTALVQANITQDMKWAPEQEWPTMLKFLELTRLNYDADLIIWPESAVPSWEPAVQEYLQMVNRSANLNNSAIITGILNYDNQTNDYFNALIVLGNKNTNDAEGDYFYNHINRYYKNHLLPIGEYVPFGDLLRPLAPLFNLPMSSFTRGAYVQPNLIANGLHILPLICFEIAFPRQLSANLTSTTDLLLTVSNDAWFGDSHGPHQHLEIARMRALEFGRPLLRSTNNGITAVVDHQGKIIKTIPQFEEAVLKAEINLVSGKTPYSQFGNILTWFFPLMILLINLVISRITRI